MKMNTVLALVATNVLTALLVGGGVYFYLNQGEAESIFTREYVNSEIGFSFAYPEEWGDLEAVSGRGPLYLQSNGRTFLSAVQAPYSGPDRGMGWTDAAYFIEDQQDIENFCDQPITAVADLATCEVQVNEAGLQYVKMYGEMKSEGGPLNDDFYYFFYNEESDKSIVFSPVSFTDDLLSSEQQLDAIAESMGFDN